MLVIFMTIRGNYQPLAVIAASLIANVLLLVGIILTIVTIKNKEEKNYQFHISVWGYAIFLILTVISIFSEIDLFN